MTEVNTKFTSPDGIVSVEPQFSTATPQIHRSCVYVTSSLLFDCAINLGGRVGAFDTLSGGRARPRLTSW